MNKQPLQVPPDGGSNELHSDGTSPQPKPWAAPMTPDGKTDWEKLRATRSVPPSDLYGSADERREKQAHDRKVIEDLRRMEEAKLERDKLKQGVPIPPRPTDLDNITLEWAMPKDVSALQLEYLVDPFLPARCVVGFFGRGSTAKSSFLATLAARISDDWSTLWVSVEELTDWITQRHIHAGGSWGTLAAHAYTAIKKDAQGRVVGSSFDVFRDLESAILKAKLGVAENYAPPRPLRLVVLDTAVGLTGWGKGESPNDDASVKRLLSYLQALAQRHDLCIAFIGHANKGRHDHFADTVAGSGAWTNSPRLSFVHARDRRDDYAYVMRVAKSNLSSSFAVAYSTEPVLTLHQHEDGHASVMCRVNMEPVIWGEEESLDLFDAATRKPHEEGEGGGDHKLSLTDKVLKTVVELVHTTGQPITREEVHAWLGREVGRREWRKVDDRLRLAAFQYKVTVAAGLQNKAIYQKQS